MADNLESYFKKHLSDESPGEGNWNVPSDNVWKNAAPHIVKKSGLFIPWRYIYIVGAILLAGLAFIFWPTTNTEPFSDTFSEHGILAPGNEPESSIIENSNTPILNTKSTSTVIAKENAEPTNIVIQEKTAELEPPPAENGEILINTDDNVYAGEVSLSIPTRNISINPLPLIAINSIELPSTVIDPDTVQKIYPTISFQHKKQRPKPYNNKNKIAVGVYFAPTYNSTYVSGNLSTGEIETANTFLYSNNWGAEIKYFISKRFALVTGYERSEIKSWSRSLIDFNYDLSTEHTMPGGNKENTSSIPLQTPFGEIDTEITYQFSGDQAISEGEVMQSAMETHQTILYFAIPLGVEYNIIQFSRFNWFGEGGLRYHRALKDGTSYTSRILHEGDDMNVVEEVMTGHPTYTKNYLGFYLGTGVNYQFSESFQIGGSARYFGNISKVNLQENLSTYVQGFNLKLGIIYIF